MSNSRRINKIADARAAKRQRASLGGSYHDRVVDDDDFEVVHSRESHLSSRRQHVETPRSPQKGRTTWVVGETWTPEDDPELGLDPTNWCDEEFEKEVMEPPRPVKKPAVPKKRSRVSVCPPLLHTRLLRNLILYRNGLMWCGRKTTEMPTLTKCCGGRAGGIFERPRRAQTASHARKWSRESRYTGASTASSPTSFVKHAVFVVIALSPFTTLR